MFRIFMVLLTIITSLLPSSGNYLPAETNETEGRLLVISTIDGRLIAVSPRSGAVKWKLSEAPVLKVPFEIKAGYSFLPDPRDGTLYALHENKIKRMPFTIPQLVQASPCRSTDGIMYAGRKQDTWFSLNPATGEKLETLSIDSVDKICPASGDESAVYFGRTEYTLSMFDEKSRSRKWNATFVDYSSHILPADLNYSYKHYSSSSGGHLVSIDGLTGSVLWESKFDSMIVALFVLENDGLHRLPFTILGRETLNNMLLDAYETNDLTLFGQESFPGQRRARFTNIKRGENPALYPALYIGEFNNGIYAVPSLVDEFTATFVPKSNEPPRISGPSHAEVEENENSDKLGQKFVAFNYDLAKFRAGDAHDDILLLGYHKIPELAESLNLFTVHNVPMVRYSVEQAKISQSFVALPGYHTPIFPAISSLQSSNLSDKNADSIYNSSHLNSGWFSASDFVKIFVTSIVTGSFIIIVTVTVLRRIIIKNVIMHSEALQVSNRSERTQGNDDASCEKSKSSSTYFTVGKIGFHLHEILGRGCEGTVVYKGVFDGRDVAVKRVVSDFFNLADREVDLLRASDSHPNVIRYFCMEADSQFRYIALELCSATLNDFVEDSSIRDDCPLSSISILEQATLGLAHLHGLKIVHRDVKPHNILLSRPNVNGRMKILISDFGLCKKLSAGRNSFSKRSGFTGTDGWIAPEMLSNGNATCSVDIFSLGCVFYYLLTLGYHPFGDSFRRQANIVAGFYDLDRLILADAVTSKNLIESMLTYNPAQRPSANTVLLHPLFWTKSKILAFFQDVSDRVDKEDNLSVVVQRLEKGAWQVVNKDWRQHICDGLLTDLKSRRTYRGTSVRDLLRALRNKKNHFRELPEDVKSAVGEVPEDLVAYFTRVFPPLLIHVYEAIRICDDEPAFRNYYHAN